MAVIKKEDGNATEGNVRRDYNYYYYYYYCDRQVSVSALSGDGRHNTSEDEEYTNCASSGVEEPSLSFKCKLPPGKNYHFDDNNGSSERPIPRGALRAKFGKMKQKQLTQKQAQY